MLIGYARVSTEDQDLTLQRAALKEAGCKRIYEEKVTGAKRDRPQLVRMLDQLRAGDVVVVSRLDRLARSTRDLLEIAAQLNEAQAGLRSLHEPWADTTSPAGRMVLTVFAGIAEFERELIRERTHAGRQGRPGEWRTRRPPTEADRQPARTRTSTGDRGDLGPRGLEDPQRSPCHALSGAALVEGGGIASRFPSPPNGPW